MAVISGQVSLDGKPLERGAITFLPAAGGSRSSGTRIERGEYSLPDGAGLPPGRYEVRIVAYQSTGRTLPDPDLPGQFIEETRQIAPARYNSQSELQIEVKPEGEDRFAFDLYSTP
jgi:hypothetical protein